MEQSEIYNRLRWRCARRALLEMDVLLGNFLENRYSSLNPEQAAAFEALVDMQDQDIWALVTGKRVCESHVQADIIAMMKNVRVK